MYVCRQIIETNDNACEVFHEPIMIHNQLFLLPFGTVDIRTIVNRRQPIMKTNNIYASSFSEYRDNHVIFIEYRVFQSCVFQSCVIYGKCCVI